MWSVSDRFLEALKGPHHITSVVTATPPGGVAFPVDVEGGSVSVDTSSAIRRKATLTCNGTSAVYKKLSTPGTLIVIQSGVVFGSSSELVPVFTGEVVGDGKQDLGDGRITVTLADHAQWLSRTKFLVPYKVASGTSRTQAIADVVTFAKPGTTIVNESSDTGTVQATQAWDDGPLTLIRDLTTDGNTTAYFRADGTFVIRDLPSIATTPVWTASAGSYGVLKSVARTRPFDRLYNTVVVRPGASDGSQTWTQQVASIIDTSNPRHPNYIGVVPYFWSSPTIRSAAGAASVAAALLEKVQGTTESLSLESIANPALEGNDVIRVITPQLNIEEAQIFQHFIDGYTLSLETGDMSINTRSQLATDE